MWADLEYGFKAAFSRAWEAFRAGTVPIGAAVLNAEGALMASARNQIASEGDGPLSHHQLAHAEINAILALPEREHPDIRSYTLYATMEPCPFCFGAVVMGSIKRVKYGARDTWAGAAGLNKASDYIIAKRITVEGPFPEPEAVQMVLASCADTVLYGRSGNKVLDRYAEIQPGAVSLGIAYGQSGQLMDMAKDNAGIDEIYDFILSKL